MALSGKSGRQGSAEKPAVIPHTRIEEESHLQEYYDIGIKLGEGTFGIVKEALHKETGKKWACKAVNKEKAGTPGIKLLEREVAILKRVHHEHIILLKEIFESSKKMYLMMEYCDRGELADVLKEKGTFPESDVKVIIDRLAQAIAYLHKHDMVHRDLKLENILLAKNPQDSSDDLYIKVTDFGLSVVKSGVGVDNLLMDFCGTPMYMAPEIIDNKTYGEKCDVWAMGVIAFLLLSGTPPFHSRDEDQLYEIIKTADIQASMSENEVWKSVSQKAKHCVEKMLVADPAHRYSASEILDHPWITGKDFNSVRPGNVLDMMKAWRNDPDFIRDGESDGAINGESSSTEILESSDQAKSVSSSRSNSASSQKKEDRRNSNSNIAASKKKPSNQAGISPSKVGKTPVTSNTTRNNPSQVTATGRTSKPANGTSRVTSDSSTKTKKKPQR